MHQCRALKIDQRMAAVTTADRETASSITYLAVKVPRQLR